MGRPKKGTEAYLRYQKRQQNAKLSKSKDIAIGPPKRPVTLSNGKGEYLIPSSPKSSKSTAQKRKRRSKSNQDRETGEQIDQHPNDDSNPFSPPQRDQNDIEDISFTELMEPKRPQSVKRRNPPQRNVSDNTPISLTMGDIKKALTKGIGYRLTSNVWILNRLRRDGRVRHAWVHVFKYIEENNVKWNLKELMKYDGFIR